ncbi:MAG: hypothetical protein WAU32_08650 [Thermoanaerobaculia bacterium]
MRYIGVTHYTASAYPEVARVLRREKLDFVQINYSIFEPAAEAEILPLAAAPESRSSRTGPLAADRGCGGSPTDRCPRGPRPSSTARPGPSSS